MLLQSGGLIHLECQRPGSKVADRANLHRDAAFCHKFHQRGIVNCRDAMSDALGAQQFDRFTDFLRAANFTGVYQLTHPQFSNAVVDPLECFCRNT